MNLGIKKNVNFIISMQARESDDTTWETILDNEIHERTVECEIVIYFIVLVIIIILCYLLG